MEAFMMASYFNLFAIPFIIYSLYYQIRVYKHWCFLCLSVLTILVYLLVVAGIGGFWSLTNTNFIIRSISYVSILLLIIWSCNMYMSLHERNNAYNTLFSHFNNLRFKAGIFDILLKDNLEISHIPQEMSINIGEPTSSKRILKVCNPFCSACAKSHLKMEELLIRKHLYLQIIFNVSSEDSDAKKNVVKLFFALKEKYGDLFMPKVLHNWYSRKEKSYESFLKDYVIDKGLIEKQEYKIVWMEQKVREL